MPPITTLVTAGTLARRLGCTRQAILNAEMVGRIPMPITQIDGGNHGRLRVYTESEAAAIARIVTGGHRAKALADECDRTS